MSDEVFLRRGGRADVPFIANAWLKSYRNAPAVAGVPDRVYFYFHHKILEELLPDGEVWVLCNADNHDQILGWICATPTTETLVLHYIYVKHVFRGMGFAKRLFEHVRDRYPDMAVTFTHKSPAFWKKPKEGRKPLHAKTRELGWVYHPYLLMMTLPEGWEKHETGTSPPPL